MNGVVTEDETGRALRAAYAGHGGVTAIFSARVADYVASRPDYPPALLDRLRDLTGLGPGATIADIGAGTGCLTRGLLERGYRAIAVEPNGEMRSAADSLLHGYSAYRSVAGSAEATTLDACSVDLVAAAQAFHWFDAALARREFLRILAPEGKVALIWNDRVLSHPFHVALDRVLGGWGGPRREALVAHEDRSRLADFFGDSAIDRIDMAHEHRLARSGLRSLAFSRSYMPGRDSADGAQIERELDAVFDEFAQTDEVTVPYRTIVVIGRPA